MIATESLKLLNRAIHYIESHLTEPTTTQITHESSRMRNGRRIRLEAVVIRRRSEQ